MPALVQNSSPGTGQQAQLASWLRQATGGITPTQHTDPPAAPWYAEAMNARQAAQAEMVREWKIEQERKAEEAAAAAAAAEAARGDTRSSWVRFRDEGNKAKYPWSVSSRMFHRAGLK